MIALAFFALILVPIVSADILVPGEKIIPIENRITNIADYTGYAFVAVPMMGDRICPVGSEAEPIGGDGKISPVYKFCSISVYAFNNSEFEIIYLNNLYLDAENNGNMTVLDNYLSENGKKVLEGIKTSESVSDSDPREVIVNEYSLSLEELKSEPDNVIVKRNFLIYFYILAPIVALGLIVYYLIRRRK